jgi:transcriptional regulator with XRE-family HTH domain
VVAANSTSNARTGSRTRRPIEDDLGRRLRTYREERQISLRELARRLKISPSAISQFETGKSRLSVNTLYAIVTELEISLDTLFNGIGEDGAAPIVRAESPSRGVVEPPAPYERHVQRGHGRRALELETGVRWERLTPESDREADFLYVIYDVGGSSGPGDAFMRHAGHEYGLVLSGTLEVTVGFDVYTLGSGDSISFDSTVPHRLRNIGSEPVHGVWFVIGRQNDPRTAAES